MASGLNTSWQIDGEKWMQGQILFSWAPKSLQIVTVAMKLKFTCFLADESSDKPRQCVKKQKHHFAEKCPYNPGYGLSSSHVWM